jgi:predicted phage terminase large subunit-like protein
MFPVPDFPPVSAGDLDDLHALNAEESLIAFIELMWRAVEPRREFVTGWAIEAILEHLEAVARGDIARLVINCPPGLMKSLSSQVFMPAWIWGPLSRPEARFMCASYSAALTERDNGRMIQLMSNEIYRRHWGKVFTATDSRVKIANDKTGWKLATSVGGVGTGERADVIVIDDALSVKEAESATVRETMQRWLLETIPTRLNDPERSAIVLIEHRTHEGDATGTWIANGVDFEHLMIPMEWDGRRYTTGIGWRDPRTVIDIEPDAGDGREWWRVRGELCFPERFPVWVVERDKKVMGSYATAGQFQQMPSPRGGGIIQRDWWIQWGPDDPVGMKFPPFDLVIAWFDGAYTTKAQNDPSALAVLGVFADRYPNPGDVGHRPTGAPKVMLVKCWAERLALHDAVQKVDKTCCGSKVSILLVENKATGLSVVQELHRLFVGKSYSVVEVSPGGMTAGGDKVARAMSVVPMFEGGMVYYPRTDWGVAAVEEMAVFPRGAHDDRVDAIVGGLRWLRDNGMLALEDEWVAGEREEVVRADVWGRQAVLYRT